RRRCVRRAVDQGRWRRRRAGEQLLPRPRARTEEGSLLVLQADGHARAGGGPAQRPARGPSVTRPRWRGYLLVVIAVSCFGAAGALAKFLFLNGVTPEQLVQLRLLTASLGLWAVVALTSIGARGQA